MDSLSNMQGGEIFIPKLPSIKILDLAKAINPNAKIKIIGIRPGEKIHEVLCPSDEWHNTIEFNKNFIIKPSILFSEKKNYFKSIDGDNGKSVKENFEYNSYNKKNYLSIESIKKIINQLNKP